MEKAKIAIEIAEGAMRIVHGFHPNVPARPVERDFKSGGKHVWGEKTHAMRSGRGIFGQHWECTNPNCKYYDDASLYDTIKNSAPCTQKCINCGDWIYNAR